MEETHTAAFCDISMNQVFLNFSLQHIGKYPMYDVTVIIRDVTYRSNLLKSNGFWDKTKINEEWEKLKKDSDLLGLIFKAQSKSEIYRKTWPTLSRDSYVPLIHRLKLNDDTTKKYFLVKIYSRNAVITQPIKMQKIKGKWKDSTRIQKYDNNQHKTIEIDNDLDPDVPLEDAYAGE